MKVREVSWMFVSEYSTVSVLFFLCRYYFFPNVYLVLYQEMHLLVIL